MKYTQTYYPFAALVGQEKLKRALLLCAINPEIGGVLIKGDKGTAKSTAARGLAQIAPAITKVAGCPYNCDPVHPLDTCEVCQDKANPIQLVEMPLVTLPLGATEERIVGSLDLEGVLSERKKKFLPGLLAAAHRGVLYIDEVNLLSDHLVDVLLDAAAMGVNTVQREGLSVSHPARFTLIGTMNPEEGNLRPQFLDRFGLMVEIEAPRDTTERTEVVRRRIAYDADPAAFITQWQIAQQALQKQLTTARQLLTSVHMPDHLLELISQLCMEMGVVSLRADIVMYKTARTLAALAQRTEVVPEDIRHAAELVLLHRRRQKPFSSDTRMDEKALDDLMQQAQSTTENKTSDSKADASESLENQAPDDDCLTEDCLPDPSETEQEGEKEQVFASIPIGSLPDIQIENGVKTSQNATEGNRNQNYTIQKGKSIRSVPDKQPTNLAIEATLQQALLRNPDEWQITRDDLHQRIREDKKGNLILFVVDASGSMAASRRMEAVKGSVLALLTNAYQQRDWVSVIAFRGIEAQVLLEPTHSIEKAEKALHSLPTGGRTPLPHALQLTLDVVDAISTSTLQPLVIILSDGKANVPLPGGGNPWSQIQVLGNQLKEQQIPSLILDTESDYLRLGKARELAAILGGEYLSLDEISSDSILQTITIRMHAG
ncbi:putative cobaltochelatase [Cytophagaceae bacterium DM2B3-1]|uniref:Mg-protoporphyrin IX chelatase n=1 Tax=Xanthocytophaga flava TaxID=3048013 RepID=A0ABT7CX91_9BACT|nr:putative cobaltochelatase [Xanthocytophaga flavus]MDJ1467487.1 putative cobaltochelatase [Xanthocytophaga flavus]MDJ1498388.1 putative cobaltochelatase [Xanthocytophaga flavus]